MKLIKTPVDEFRERLEGLSREELLEIIKDQNPHYIKHIKKIEFVFENNLRHLHWRDGSAVDSRPITREELITLVDPPFIYSKEYAKMGFNEDMQRQLHIANDPILWAKEYLDLKPRAYQVLVIRDPSKQRVLRWGRRLGKTFSLALYALWYAYVNPDGKVLVLSPMKSQVGLIFDEIMQMAERNPEVRKSIVRDVTSPQYEINLANGSTIRFFTTGMKSGGKSNVTRGQEADLIILDEMDYMGPDDLVAVLAMMQQTNEEKMTEKKLIGASTPSGLRNTFWEWNTNPEYEFSAWWFPSYVNPGWTVEIEKQFRLQYSENAYRQEFEADWGEAAEGVYPRRSVDRAFKEPGWTYEILPEHYDYRSKFIMGIDWDKYGAGVNIVVLEMCHNDHPDEMLRGKIRVCFREEVKKGEFTYTAAVDRIIYLNELFNFEWIYADRGAGEMQIEKLHAHGLSHTHTGLHKKVVGWQFRENIEIKDPFTKQPVKKPVKAFMIDNLYRMLEEEKIIFSEEDDQIYFQLISYVVLATSVHGEPKFGASPPAVDHAHDALILACLAIAQHYDELLRIKYATKPHAVSNEAFLNLFNVDTQEDEELVKDRYGNSKNTPIAIRRAMTANVNSRRGRSRNAIQRKTF